MQSSRRGKGGKQKVIDCEWAKDLCGGKMTNHSSRWKIVPLSEKKNKQRDKERLHGESTANNQEWVNKEHRKGGH